MPTYPENFSGIIEALNEVRDANYEQPKTYPHNFAGIIEALKDLGKVGDAGSGSTPPNWIPSYDQDGNIIGGGYDELPRNGQLWFDVRQGRLFVYEDGQWYQANGADGLTIVGQNLPTREVVGGLWYNTTNNSLYIYDGSQWSIVGGATAYDTNALALANPTTARYNNSDNYLPDVGTMTTQADANNYYYDAIRALDTELLSANNAIAAVPAQRVPTLASIAPTNPNTGDFWQDQSTGELRIYNGSAWQATSEATQAELDAITSAISTLTTNTNNSISTIESDITALEARPANSYTIGTGTTFSAGNVNPSIYIKEAGGTLSGTQINGAGNIVVAEGANGITIAAAAIETAVADIEADYLTSADKTDLEGDITAIENTIAAFTYPSGAAFTALQNTVNALPTASDLADRLHKTGGSLLGAISMNNNKITNLGAPTDMSDAARKQDVEDLKTFVGNTYFLQNGGVLQTVQMRNTQINSPSFDFSGQTAYGTKAFKFKTNGGTSNTSLFGTNSNSWEYAWEFDSNEDYCWTHGTNGKTASINKDGIATTQLLIGNFAANDTANGRVMSNPVNVGTLLATHTSQIAQLQTDVNSVATDIYYQDAAPTTGISNGNLWFDTINIRLLVRHGGAWVNADRVEDTTLKTDLYNAVNGSTDYASLKSALLTALS